MEQIKQKIEQAKVWKESRKKWKGFEQIYMFSESELFELLEAVARESYNGGFKNGRILKDKFNFNRFWQYFLQQFKEEMK